MKVWKIYTCEKTISISSPMNLHFYLSDYTFLWKSQKWRISCQGIAGASNGGEHPQDGDVITGSLRPNLNPPFFGCHPGRKNTQEKLTLWKNPTMNELIFCISPLPKCRWIFSSCWLLQGGLEEHPQHANRGLARSWQRHNLCCGGVARARKPTPQQMLFDVHFVLFISFKLLIYCT